jgi:hypothetical protein
MCRLGAAFLAVALAGLAAGGVRSQPVEPEAAYG